MVQKCGFRYPACVKETLKRPRDGKIEFKVVNLDSLHLRLYNVAWKLSPVVAVERTQRS